METEKGNLVEEVVSLQEKLSELRLEKESEIERVKKDLEGKGTNDRESAELRLKVLSLESEKRKLEGEVRDLKEKCVVSGADVGDNSKFHHFAFLHFSVCFIIRSTLE